MKILIFSIVLVAVTSAQQRQLVLDYKSVGQKNFNLTSAYMTAKESAIFDQIKDIVVVSPAVRTQIVQSLNSAINETFTDVFRGLITRANETINHFMGRAVHLLNEFQLQVNRSSARKPNCSIYSQKASELFSNVTKNAQLCANSTIEAMGYAGRFSLEEFFEKAGQRLYGGVIRRYLICLSDSRRTNINANGTCQVDVTQLAMANQNIIRGYLALGVNSARLRMQETMVTAPNCLRITSRNEEAAVSKIKNEFNQCLYK